MSERRSFSNFGLAVKYCEHCTRPILDEQRSTRRFCNDRCRSAFNRAQKYPPPAFVGKYDLLPEHIKANFIPSHDPEECWIYRTRSPNGYASNTSVKMHKASAYRLIYIMLIGPIPKGMELDHLCDNGAKGCVNPNHLWPCTHQQNMTRPPHTQAGKHMRATHCKHGHKFTPENTYTKVPGKRYCKQCHDDRRERYRREGRTKQWSKDFRARQKAQVSA